MAGSSLLLEPPFGTRSAIAVVVPTRCSSLQLVFVLVSLLLNFHLIIFLCWLAEWRQTSTWNSCACATRCRSPPWGSCATHRCICGEPTHCTRGAATIFFQLAARAVGCFVKASSSTCMCTCCTMGVRVESFDACCSNGAADDGAWRRTVRERRHRFFQRCILTHCWPSPRAAVARPGAVCVRRPPPRAKVRATASRTQPLTANAHELMLCVCVCSRAGRATDGPPLPPPLHRGPRHRRLLRRRASPAAAAAPTAAARQPRDRSASATIAVLNCAPSAAPTHEHAHRVSERYCGGHNKVSADARWRESLFSRRDILDVDGWHPSHTLSHIARSLSHSPH